MLNTQVPRGQIPELDGVRSIAILLILFCHFWPSVGYLSPFYHFFRESWFGVDLFFVLSGFLIAGILLEAKDSPHFYKNFYARRTLRIFPLYYAFLIIMFVLVAPFLDPASIDAHEFGRSGSPFWYFFYLGNVRAALANYEGQTYLTLLWSLAIEEHFYLLFPFLVANLNPVRLTRVLIGVWCFVLAFRLAALWAFPENWPLVYMFTLSRMDGLALGALLAVVWRFWGPVTKYWKIYALVGVLLLVGQGVMRAWGLPNGHRVFGYSLPSFVLVSFVAWSLLYRGQGITSFLRIPALTYIGRISYGLYLFHLPLGSALPRMLRFLGLGLDRGSASLLAARIAFCIAIASFSFFTFEQPILSLKKRFTTKALR